MKKTLILASALAIVLSAGLTARAYVLTAPHILELMVRSIGRAESLEIHQKLFVYNVHDAEDVVEAEEISRWIFPNRFRTEIRSKHGEIIHVFSKGAVLKVIDGRIMGESESGFDLYKDLFLIDNRRKLMKRLSHLGVQTSVTSLGRFEDRLAYVVGARYPDESIPQLWVDKDDFRPFRWLLTGKSGDGSEDFLEVRFLEWREVKKGFQRPMKTLFYRNGKLVREIRVEDVRVNALISNDLFDMELLQTLYQPSASPLPEAEGKEEGEVQKNLNNFRKMYESSKDENGD